MTRFGIWLSFIKKSAPVLGALSLLGCVTGDDIQNLHSHLNEVDSKVEKLAKSSSSKEEVAQLNESLSQNVSALLKSNAEIGRRFSELTSELQALAAKLEDANRRLAALSQQLADTQARMEAGGPAAQGVPASGPPDAVSGAAPQPAVVAAVPQPGRPAPKTPAPSDIYRAALADYQRGQFALARDGFQEYLGKYPKTDVSDDAAYWIGECYLAEKNPKSAVTAFDALIKDYPQSDKLAAAYLKKGLTHLELGEKAQGITLLQQVVHKFPGTDEAKIARQRLKALGSDSR